MRREEKIARREDCEKRREEKRREEKRREEKRREEKRRGDKIIFLLLVLYICSFWSGEKELYKLYLATRTRICQRAILIWFPDV